MRRVVVVRWMMVVMIVRIIWISPSPIWIVTIVEIPSPIVAVWRTPIEVWVVPTVVPAIRWYCHCAPCAEHRGYILWLNPNHIARNHYVVHRRVVCRYIVKCVGVTPIVVRRRHTIGWRREAIQTTSIGTLVGVGEYGVIAIHARRERTLCNGDIVLGRLGLDLCQSCLVLRLLCLVLCLCQLRFRLLTIGYRYLVVYCVEVVRILRAMPCRCASRHQKGLCQKYGK